MHANNAISFGEVSIVVTDQGIGKSLFNRLITERNLLMMEKYPNGFSHEDDSRNLFEDHEDADRDRF